MFWNRPPLVVKLGFLAMGTEITVTIFAGSRSSRAKVDAAISEVQKLIGEFGRDGWAWGEGALGDFNRALARGAVAAIPAGLKPLFARAWAVRQSTGALFEPRIGALVHLWGFDEVARIRESPPSRAEIKSLMAALRIAPELDDQKSYGPAPNITWDFGGIGKGYIVDIALDLLASRGFANATIDAGGNLAVRGSHGDRPWRIAIRDPRADSVTTLLGALNVCDEAVITHGDDQRFFEYAGKRYAHILDPSTGMPAQGLRSLTVVHPDATFADAAGAAMFVAGPQNWAALARKLQLPQVMIVESDGSIKATPAMVARLEARPGLLIETVL